MRKSISIIVLIILSSILCSARYQERREVLFDGRSDNPTLQPGERFKVAIAPVERDCPARAFLLVRGHVLNPSPFDGRGMHAEHTCRKV